MAETMTAPAGTPPPDAPKVATAAPGWDDDIIKIGDRIANLTLVQAVELGEYLEQVHGVKSSGGVPEIDPNKQPPPPPPPQEVQTEFAVVLESVPDVSKKIGLVKVYREITALGLKESKDAVDDIIATSTPKVVREGISKAEAERLKVQLEAAGGKVSIK
jgi:large subunit ribosomal protein L7/L12